MQGCNTSRFSVSLVIIYEAGTVIPYVSLANWWFQPLTQLSGQLKLNIAIVKRDKSKSKKGNYQIKTGEKFSPCILPGEAPRHGAPVAEGCVPPIRPVGSGIRCTGVENSHLFFAVLPALVSDLLCRIMKLHLDFVPLCDISLIMAEKDKDILENIGEQEYKYGFTTDIETETIGKGLNEEVVRLISAKKGEPAWMTERRVAAYRHWLTLEPPTWAHLTIPEIDFQDIIYYAAPKPQKKLNSMDEVDPELKRTFDKLGIPLEEQMALAGVAVDAVMDSVSVKTTFKEVLAEKGIIFCSISEALRDFPDLVKKYLGSVVPYTDNFYAALNAAVFSDGSFCYIPKGVRCPMELSTYFRINAAGTGQFERTLIVADEGAYVSYLEGCTAPRRDENQLHAAVVEIIVEKDAEVKYSTVQNWYPGDREGRGGIYNFVTKRGICRENARLSWTQVETGSAITWKYPSCILAGDNSVGEFYSVAMTNNFQQADTGTKMIHIGRNTRSRIVSKGISAGRSENSYRGLVRMAKGAENARNYSQCDSLLIGDKCGAHTFPVIDSRNRTAVVEHEATTSKISDDQLFYCNQRGLSTEDAVGLIVNGYAREVLAKLPMEFAVEAQKLLSISLEGSVG